MAGQTARGRFFGFLSAAAAALAGLVPACGSNESTGKESAGACTVCTSDGACPSGQRCATFSRGSRFCAGTERPSECCSPLASGGEECQTYDPGALGGTGGAGAGGIPNGDAGLGGAVGAGGRGSGGRAVGAGGAAGTETSIGEPCDADADCGAGFTCLTPEATEFGGGGPSSGLCTVDCSGSADAGRDLCVEIDPGTGCVLTGTGAFCMRRCMVGPVPAGGQKCNDRVDVACQDAGGGDVCLPQCRGDFDCGSRKCDLFAGVCVDEAPGTRPIGSSCVGADADVDACLAGFCLQLAPTAPAADFSTCSGYCTLGTLGCGSEPDSGRVESACLLPVVPGSGPGDLGFCLQLCDCDDDCLNPAFVCDELPAQAADITGRAGACTPATGPAGAPVSGRSCTDAGAGDAGRD